MTEITTCIAVDREHLAELREVWPTWQRWHPELTESRTIVISDNGYDLPMSGQHVTNYLATYVGETQKDRMLGSLLYTAPPLIETPYWLKIDCDTIATGPGPPLTDFIEGVDSIAASPWPYSKPVDAITQLNDWYGAVTGEPPLEGVQYRPEGHSRERERAYYPRIIGWITIVNTAFSRHVAEFLVKHPPPFISHDTLLWYLAERWNMPAKKIKFGRLGWDHRLGVQSIKERVVKVKQSEAWGTDVVDSPAFGKAAGWTSTATPEPQTKKFNPGSGHEVVLANLLAEHFGIAHIVGVEVGVFEGKTSAYLLAQLPHLKLWMVDPWTEFKDKSELDGDSISGASQADMDAARDKAYLATTAYRSRRAIIESRSLDVVQWMDGMQFDFVFLDAAHSYNHVAADLQAWWPLVKPGGLLLGHDYGHRRFKGVAKAVNEFASANELTVEECGASVWMVRR
jgi:hypothetical protein